jgi:hypothetical protein
MEASAMVMFMVLVGMVIVRPADRSLVPISVEALASGDTTEEWLGIYFDHQKVGYAVNTRVPTVDGGLLLQHHASFTVAAFGKINRIVSAGTAVLDKNGVLQVFDAFLEAEPVRLNVRGEVRGDKLVISLLQGGEHSELILDLDAPPQVSATLNAWIAMQDELKVGQKYEVPYFSPTTLSQDVMTLKVISTEVLPNGEEAHWIERSVAGVTTRALLTPAGDLLREEGGFGTSLVRLTREQALAMPEGQEPVDIIALSSVRLVGYLPNARQSRNLTLQILGVEPERIRNEPPLQTRVGDQVTMVTPRVDDWEPVPRQADPEAFAVYLESTPFLQVEHREIVDAARELAGPFQERLPAVRKLNNWVFETLVKTPVMGVPNALEVLRIRQGDCNEHTALMVALARAAGIPARIAAGVVYSDRVAETGAFYYHAWPEVYMGEEGGWIPVDPTFGQVPADATHVKIVEGDLGRQIEIMGVMGRLGFKLIKGGDF